MYTTPSFPSNYIKLELCSYELLIFMIFRQDLNTNQEETKRPSSLVISNAGESKRSSALLTAKEEGGSSQLTSKRSSCVIVEQVIVHTERTQITESQVWFGHSSFSSFDSTFRFIDEKLFIHSKIKILTDKLLFLCDGWRDKTI